MSINVVRKKEEYPIPPKELVPGQLYEAWSGYVCLGVRPVGGTIPEMTERGVVGVWIHSGVYLSSNSSQMFRPVKGTLTIE